MLSVFFPYPLTTREETWLHFNHAIDFLFDQDRLALCRLEKLIRLCIYIFRKTVPYFGDEIDQKQGTLLILSTITRSNCSIKRNPSDSRHERESERVLNNI